MNTRIWWALLCSSLLLGAAGCSEVEHCKQGEQGCIGGTCEDDGDCKFDLQCLVDSTSGDRVCGVKRGDEFDCGSQIASCREPTECNCGGGEVCAPGTTDTCINYCEAPEFARLSVPYPGSCERVANDVIQEVVPLTFEEACVTRCRQRCAQLLAYCPGATCDPADCSRQAVMMECREDCPLTGGNPVECMTNSCIAVSETACEDVECPGGAAPECGAVACENNCAFNHDGECDDGDFASADSAGCNWGTDCADCGPRRGAAPTALGDLCIVDWGCADYRSSVSQNNAWCVQIEGLAKGVKRCVPDCSRGQLCPEGYMCAPVEPNDPELDNGSTSACYPVICQ